ncbi:MAG: hypothetical protein ACFFD9_09570 [Candidatus Thorarchaeota archaeon]
MKELTPEGPIMVTTSSHELVSHEKAVLELKEGCAWVYLTHNGEREGIAFAGPSRLAVDAITETEAGASGESVTATLQGIQVYLGEAGLEELSREAGEFDVDALGFEGITGFMSDVNTAIRDKVNGRGDKRIHDQKGSVLLGTDSHSKSIVLAVGEKGLAFVYDENVFAIGDEQLVQLDRSGVRVRGKEGRPITICSDGIIGLEGFNEIGPAVGTLVSGALKSLVALKPWKSLKAIRSMPPVWDNVDDFDWDD